MIVARIAAAAAFCGLASASSAFAQQKAGVADSGWTAVLSGKTAAKTAAAKPEFAWPKLPEKQPDPRPANAPPGWTNQEVELARARCAVLLKDLDVVVVPEAPVRDGAECGTPAPMQLVSIGSSPQVAFSPPPSLTCDMIAAVHKWMQGDVQAAARKHLGAPVVRVATMSSYSCRNAYGRAKGRLSEHGRMNAIDIGAFTTADGRTAMVLADWGPNAREIAAKAAEEQRRVAAAAEAAAKAKKTAEDNKVATTAPAPIPAPVPAPSPLRPSIAATVVPGITLQMPSTAPAALSLSQPTRLGGPKSSTAPPSPAPAMTGTAQFLRTVHRSACQIFGTVLGPEANAAHNNHFHLDMAERKVRVICE
jgi:hypothetical protein